MASKLGGEILRAREARGIGLRALARAIGRSPTFLVMIEKGDPAPGVGEETLRRLARELEVNSDRLMLLAGKVPSDVAPSDEIEVAVFRIIKRLSSSQKQRLLHQLRRRVRSTDR